MALSTADANALLAMIGNGNNRALVQLLTAIIAGEVVALPDDITASAAELNILDGATVTTAEINSVLDQSANWVDVTNAASYTVLAANSGKVHYLPDMTAACSLLLPAEAAGLEYEFVYVGGALDAHGFVINSESDTNFFVGGIVHADMDAGAGTDELVAVYPDGNSNSKLTASSVGAGTRVKVKCRDGVQWTITGVVYGNTAPVFADQ